MVGHPPEIGFVNQLRTGNDELGNSKFATLVFSHERRSYFGDSCSRVVNSPMLLPRCSPGL